MSDNDTDDDERTLRDRIPFRGILNAVLLVLLILLVIPFAIYVAPQAAGAEHSYIVLSGSMEPEISPGDVIIVEETPTGEIDKRDVITFARNGQERPTTHRVVDIVEQEESIAFRTKGDSNDEADPELVAEQEVVGKVPTVEGQLFVIPFIGHVIRFGSTPAGFGLLVVVPISLLIGSEIFAMAKSARATDEKSDDDGDDDLPESVADSLEAEESPATIAGVDIQETGDSVEEDEPEHHPGPVTHVDSAALSTGFQQNGRSKTETEPETIVVEKTVPADDGEQETDEDGQVTLTAPELELGLLVLAAFLGYSGWIAYNTLTIWSLATAGAVAAAFVLLFMLYVVGRMTESAASDSSTDTETATDTGPSLDESTVREQLATARVAAQTVHAEIELDHLGTDSTDTLVEMDSSGLTADGGETVESSNTDGAMDG